MKKQPSNCTWDELFNSDTIPPSRPGDIGIEDHLLLGETVVAVSGDVCKVGSWIFYCSQLVRCTTLSQPLYRTLTGSRRQRHVSQTTERSRSLILPWRGASLRSLRLNPFPVTST